MGLGLVLGSARGFGFDFGVLVFYMCDLFLARGGVGLGGIGS